MRIGPTILLFVFLAAAGRLSASVAFLLGEPFGTFGAFNPTGHASVYLSRVCAETPTLLRRCAAGENGVVISRYARVAGYDWIAIPLMPYLYAVERPEDVPEEVDAAAVARLRDDYRRLRLRDMIPDGPDGEMPKGDWIQLVGSAYDRTIHGFSLETTPEQDDELIAFLNSRPNRKRFNLFFRNCADFARRIVNFYHPGAIRRNFVADLGITTPKHSAKAIVKFSRRTDTELSYFAVPQIPGVKPSTSVRGVSESLIRSKKYAVPLVLVQPWVAASALAAYIASGRFNPARPSQAVCAPGNVAECFRRPGETPPAGTLYSSGAAAGGGH